MTEANLRLRGYKPEDLDAIAALDAVCFQFPFRFSKASMRRFAEADNAIVRLAYLPDNQTSPEPLAGFGIVHLERPQTQQIVGYVTTLDVAGQCRGRGVGYGLMRSLEGLAAQAGAEAMTLHVSVRNASAIRLYERLGYGLVRIEEGFYGVGGDAWVYRRALP